MTSSKLLTAIAIITAIVAVPVIYWALLLSLDCLIGTQQLHNWAQHESRRQLATSVLSISGWLLVIYTPVLAILLTLVRIGKRRLHRCLLPVAASGLGYGLLLHLGFSPLQGVLHVATAALAVAVALLIRSLPSILCRR